MDQFQSSPADIVSELLVSSKNPVEPAVHDTDKFPFAPFLRDLTVVAVALAVATLAQAFFKVPAFLILHLAFVSVVLAVDPVIPNKG